MKFSNTYMVNLTRGESVEALGELPDDAIVITFTGTVRPNVFEKLLSVKTTYPPVIEGANSVECCELSGLPFLRGGRWISPEEEKVVLGYDEAQSIHSKASEFLSKQDAPQSYSQSLANYMLDSRDGKNKAYHAARQAQYLARPDGMEVALSHLQYEFVKEAKVEMSKCCFWSTPSHQNSHFFQMRSEASRITEKNLERADTDMCR